jgi:hypothetical protein
MPAKTQETEETEKKIPISLALYYISRRIPMILTIQRDRHGSRFFHSQTASGKNN